MEKIEQGVRRFQEEVYPRLSGRFRELAGGQSPEVLFVACSDSRVDPSLITQTGPGELFILRNAGNLVPVWGIEKGADAAVEYAVAVLGVKHVVVCGHSGCGAIGGALNPDALDAVPSVKDWVGHAEPSVHATAHLHGDERVRATISHSAERQLDNLKTHPSVAAAVAAGNLELHAWVYDIPTGEVAVVATRREAA